MTGNASTLRDSLVRSRRQWSLRALGWHRRHRCDGGASPRRDSVLMLYPPWWPVGDSVELPTMRPAFGDTIVGRATALVSDGRKQALTSRVRAWQVRCGEAP
jgi:hypothetical protein